MAGLPGRMLACLLMTTALNAGVTETDFIQGLYHAYWLTVPLPVSVVQQMLPDRVSLISPNWPGLPSGTHPTVIELGLEYDCGPIILSPLRSNFSEAKFEIPWTQLSGTNNKPLTHKIVLYMDSLVNIVSSPLLYGLNTHFSSKMNMSSQEYEIRMTSKKLQASITQHGPCSGISYFPEFQWYKTIMQQAWFGDAARKICGQHTYHFDTATICPVNVTLMSDPGFLNQYFPSDPVSVPNILSPLGAVEVLVGFTITYPYVC